MVGIVLVKVLIMSGNITMFLSQHVVVSISTTICMELAGFVALGVAGSTNDSIQMHVFGKAGATVLPCNILRIGMSPNINLTLPVKSEPKEPINT
jgi:hypothetical protein